MRAPPALAALVAVGLASTLAGCQLVEELGRMSRARREKRESPPEEPRPSDEGGPPGSRDRRGFAIAGEALVVGSAFDGRVAVDGVRGRSSRETLWGGEFRGDLSTAAWRFELAAAGNSTTSSLGIPDQKPGDPLVDSDTDNWFSSLQVGAGPRILDTHPARGGTGDGAGTPDRGEAGTRLDLVGGLWVEQHWVTQTDFNPGPDLPGEETTESATWNLPYAGLRACHDLPSGLRFQERIDVGGFRPGEQFAWRAEAAVSLRCSERLRVSLGWILRRIDVGGAGRRRDGVDALISGPFVGLELRF